MTVEGLTYTQYVQSLTNPNAVQTMLNLENAVNSGAISQYEFASTIETITGKTVVPHRAYNGDILGYTLEEITTRNNANPINSNASTVSRGTIARPISSTVSEGKSVIQGLRGVGSKVVTGAGLVAIAAAAVGTGCQLGLNIDKTLYNLNPDIFGNTPIGSLDTSSFEKIIVDSAASGDLGGKLLQAIFGIDPSTGEGQMYIDENAYAYMAAYLQSIGAFDFSTILDEDSLDGVNFSQPISIFNINASTQLYYTNGSISPMYVSEPLAISTAGNYLSVQVSASNYANISIPCVAYVTSTNQVRLALLFDTSIYPSFDRYIQWGLWNYVDGKPTFLGNTSVTTYAYAYTYDGKSSNADEIILSPKTGAFEISNFLIPISSAQDTTQHDFFKKFYWACLFGERKTISPYDGIDVQDGATLPSGLTGVPADDLDTLQQQYPDLWNNAIQYPVIQPDGSVKNFTYVPIPMPENNPRNSTQPETGNSSQTDTSIQPDTATQTLIEYLTKTLTNPYPKTEQDMTNDTPPENPIDTGEGSTPTGALPVGSASSLWAIYHPTQAQIDSFGAWLWSPNFIDQIAKIFNNPMESIIGLHKVYATPIDAGNSTIHVGYLDSGVASAYITQQYVYVDCGTVDLMEQFGNVFDYSPFSTVKLYLPFIGIVSLNLDEVMRSSINVTYGVDVLTGACLAIVNVSRDGNESVLYQYSGNCAVQYPLSSGSYMGIVSSIIGVAGSAIATVATGGGVAPLALGAMGAAMNAHTSVQNSGSFSGNSGAMGGKRPYLIIERPQTKLADSFESFDGVPTNYTVSVGNCSGFIRFESVHVTDVDATDSELDEIQSLLMSGVIV